MAKETIIRIDKSDGSESEVTLDAVARIINDNYTRPDEVRAEFDAGHRIASPFAYYELRKIEEPPASPGLLGEAIANSPKQSEAITDAKRAEILELKNNLARARLDFARAEKAYGEVYPQLIAALDAAREKFERENSAVVADFGGSKLAVDTYEKGLRAALVEYREATGEKKFDEHLSIRETVKLEYELAAATKWARQNAQYLLAVDTKQFDKVAKDQEFDFVTKTPVYTAVIAKDLPVETEEGASA